jgi:malate permease and related proteins
VALVVAAIVLATAAGALAEHRYGERAQALSRRILDVMLYGLLPFATFFVIANLHLTAGVGAGIGIAYAELAIVGVLAWLVGSRVLRLPRASTGALICTVVVVNTGYLGIPLSAAVLGRHALDEAIAWDALVSGPMLYVVGFGIGAVFGTRTGAGSRERVRAFLTRNPPLAAVILGLLAPDALDPDVLVHVSQGILIGLLPIGFFVLGVNLMAEREEGVLAFPPPLTRPIAAVVLLRLVVAPGLVLLASAFIITLPDAYLLQAAMPTGINSMLVAHAYGLDLRLTSGALAWTTTLVVIAAAVGAAIA